MWLVITKWTNLRASRGIWLLPSDITGLFLIQKDNGLCSQNCSKRSEEAEISCYFVHLYSCQICMSEIGMTKVCDVSSLTPLISLSVVAGCLNFSCGNNGCSHVWHKAMFIRALKKPFILTEIGFEHGPIKLCLGQKEGDWMLALSLSLFFYFSSQVFSPIWKFLLYVSF